MKSPKHTPGPWEVVNMVKLVDDKALNIPLIFASSRHAVAEVIIQGLSLVQANANARLMAAAPALLEALELALMRLEKLSHPTTFTQNQIKAAIALATGGTK